MRRSLVLLAILALAACAGVAQVALASSPSLAPRILASSAPDGEVEEEGGEEIGACEGAAEEWSEGEFEEVEGEELEEECVEEVETTGKGFVTAPPVCLVRRAESKIAMAPAADKVRLTLRYSTYEPTEVSVGLKFKDHKGSVTIARTTRHLGAKGVLRLTAKLGAATMERARRASEFDVALHAPGTPARCSRELEQRLHTVKHGGKASRSYAG